jgi:hypothetical protein
LIKETELSFFRFILKRVVTPRRQGISKDITTEQEEKALKGKIP